MFNQKRSLFPRTALSRNQRGLALPVVVIIMVVIALLATSGMDDASMQERMAGNLRDREMAFQAAEAALRAGELDLVTTLNADPDAFSDSGHPYGVNFAQWDGSAATDTIPREALYTVEEQGVKLAGAPAYLIGQPDMIEDSTALGMSGKPPPPRLFYPVLARGVGGTAESVVVLRTVYWVE